MMLPVVAECRVDIERSESALSGRQVEVVLSSICVAARDIKIYEFLSTGHEALPPYEPGAHLDLHLGNGMVRSYSLIPSRSTGNGGYVIAVKRDPNSRGGSQYIHDEMGVGSRIRASFPKNNFPLNEEAPHSVFFAGGIGITPILSMIQRLNSINRPWTLFYSSRTRRDMAFIEELQKDDRARLHFDDESCGGVLDIKGIIAATPKDRHLYCCGPAAMLDAFEVATASWPRMQTHLEYFAPKHDPAKAGGFTVQLARSEREFIVPEGKTILQMLLDEGIDVDYSCEVGICGTCVQRVISGIPEHRDSVLSSEQLSKSDQIIICCSGSKSERLVLDL